MGSHEGDAVKNVSTTEESENCKLDKSGSKPCSPLPKLLSISRYGRTIKPKSPNTVMVESPKNSKMPKIVKQEASPEDESFNMDNTLDSTMDNSLNMSLNGSINTEDQKINNEDLEANSPWTLGQLVWARIGSFPFWPGIVTLDPESMSFVTQRDRLKSKYSLVHVRYCADKGRHSWVPFANIIPFLGLADFEKRLKEITPEIRKKEPKYAAGFVIKSSMKLKWDDAVAEASGLMAKSIEKRIELFRPKNKTKVSLNNSSDKLEENNKKRKQTSADEEVSSKKSKADIQEVEELNESLQNKTAIGNNISLETPPTPPSSHKDSSDEAPVTKKYKSRKKMGKEGVFEIFCERNRESAEQIDADATEADIKAYLLDLWENMSNQERSKYRADYLQEDDMRLYSLNIEDDDDEEDDDADEDADSEPEPVKPRRRRRTKAEMENDKIKDDNSDQEETTSVESEIIDKTVRRRRTKGSRESSDRDDADDDVNDKLVRKGKLNLGKDELVNKEELTQMVQEMARRARMRLFRGMKNERVCQICETTGKLIRCKGPCYSYFHLDCVKPGESSSEPSDTEDGNDPCREDLREIRERVREEEIFDEESFKCIDCLSGVAPACFVCHEREGERVKCAVLACGKHYHPACLKNWPQCNWQGDRLTCPYHICHICASDNPQNGHPRSTNEKFVRCVRCPSTYHASISCVPAGSNILTGNQIVCPKHYKSPHPPVNATWCFLCTEGGSLICCDTCPTSFHLECLGIAAPEGGFICEDCETGRLPLYGEVVWVKLGNYRWWPAVICFPYEIPSNIALRAHKTGEFCVMFLGTRDYYWIHRGKAFLFQDGDANTKVIGSKKVEESYRRAVEEAKIFHEQLTCEKAIAKDRDIGSRLKPPPYVKLKVNKPVGNVKIPEVDSMVACDCDPNAPNPCSPESDCLNRILLIECSPDACPAGTKCQNQLFVRRKYPAMKPVHTEERGWGLKALEPIKEGQFVIEYVGEIIDEAEYRLRLHQKRERKNENYYFLTIDNCRMIDAEPKGNLSRFMNHSCQPNCETQKWTVNGDTRIGLFALRNIEHGEELTFNYNLASDGETRKPCLCKAPNCSGFIGLKVPKNTTNAVQEKKNDNKTKKQRKYKKILNCWNCNTKIDNPNEAYRCDQKTCGKVYHPHCIAIEDGPDQIFHCPWHFCAECYKRTTIRCSFCCNAFCQTHIHGNLRKHPQTGNFICYNHPTENADYGDVDMGEAQLDDDGDDDAALIDEQDAVNSSSANDFKAVVESAANVQSEDSQRGAIVEVQASSEEGEEDEEEDDDTTREEGVSGEPGEGGQGAEDSPLASGGKRRRRSKQAESDLTLDQIAAIIGIVK